MMPLEAAAGALVLYCGAMILWLFHRMGDKLGSDKRWWVKVLDVFLIAPLIPIAYLLGKLINKEIR